MVISDKADKARTLFSGNLLKFVKNVSVRLVNVPIWTYGCSIGVWPAYPSRNIFDCTTYACVRVARSRGCLSTSNDQSGRNASKDVYFAGTRLSFSFCTSSGETFSDARCRRRITYVCLVSRWYTGKYSTHDMTGLDEELQESRSWNGYITSDLARFLKST